MHGCMKCHKCGRVVAIVLDGEEWCDACGYQRPVSHGWGWTRDAEPHEKMTCAEASAAIAGRDEPTAAERRT